jgi:hypothetical protein
LRRRCRLEFRFLGDLEQSGENGTRLKKHDEYQRVNCCGQRAIPELTILRNRHDRIYSTVVRLSKSRNNTERLNEDNRCDPPKSIAFNRPTDVQAALTRAHFCFARLVLDPDLHAHNSASQGRNLQVPGGLRIEHLLANE